MKNGFTNFYFQEISRVLDKINGADVDQIVLKIFHAWENNRTIFIIGNGGSASTSSHFACDLSKMTIVDGQKRMKVHALTDNMPIITAWANDTEYANVFVEQLKAFLTYGDLVIGISGSGNSKNVLNTIAYSNEQGAGTIGITGFEGGKLVKLASKCIVVPSNSMQVIEDAHSIITHAISLQLRGMIMDYATKKCADLIDPKPLNSIY